MIPVTAEFYGGGPKDGVQWRIPDLQPELYFPIQPQFKCYQHFVIAEDLPKIEVIRSHVYILMLVDGEPAVNAEGCVCYEYKGVEL